MFVWNWIPKQFGMADGSAYAKMLDAHAEVHDLFAREVTQNSWDAALRLRRELAGAAHPKAGDEIPFRLNYEFRQVSGADKTALLSALQIQELRETLETHGHEALKFEPGRTILDREQANESLHLLYINDYGATGLRGDPVGDGLAQSDFFRAFGQIGGNDRHEGGGSFGFGKAAFIKASRIRCVIAYSSFLPTAGDSVTRRLWGFVYWLGFSAKSGVGQLGLLNSDVGPVSVPAVDGVADQMAERFGFDVRTANSPRDCGTSLLVVDHVLDPHQLKSALERWWWPAIESYKSTFDVSVRTDREVLRPQPLLNLEVKPYVRAFEIAQDPSAQLREGEFKRDGDRRALRNLGGIGGGEMAIVRVEADSGNAEADSESDGTYAHIALIRDPRMVVNYEPFSGSTSSTAIKGVYVADSQADPYLRRAEPSTHDAWETRIDESYGPDWQKTQDVVTKIQKRIRDFVREVQKGLRPVPKKSKAQLSWTNELFSTLFKDPAPVGRGASSRNKRKKKKRQAATYVSEPISRSRVKLGEGLIAVSEEWTVDLVDEMESEIQGEIDFAVWVLADEKETSVSDRLAIESVTLPSGFYQTEDGSVVGTFKPGVSYQFTFTSAPYEQDWNVRSDVMVKPLSADDKILGGRDD